MAEPVSLASAAAGIITLGVTVCQGLLQYYSSWKDAQKDVAAMYASVEALAKTFKMIEITVQGHQLTREISERVTEGVTSCETGVNSLRKRLDKIRTTQVNYSENRLRPQFRRALYPFQEGTLLKLCKTISDLRDNLSLAISTLQLCVLPHFLNFHTSFLLCLIIIGSL